MSNPNSNPITADYIGKYSVIRGRRGFGVFAGTVEAVEGDCVKLSNARRLWYWDGAASLSQLAAACGTGTAQHPSPSSPPRV